MKRLLPSMVLMAGLMFNPVTSTAQDNLSNGIKTNTFSYTLRGERVDLDYNLKSSLNERIKGINRALEYLPGESKPTTLDFILEKLKDEEQRAAIDPLFQMIINESETDEDAARIAISVVQSIPYDFAVLEDMRKHKGRFPYQVLYDNKGVCDEKTALLGILLQKIGYGVAVFDYTKGANHQALGIKCPDKYDYLDSGYCFIETTNPSIATFSKGKYYGGKQLPKPDKIVKLNGGMTFNGFDEEFRDAKTYHQLAQKSAANKNILPQNDYKNFVAIKKKYGLSW